MTTTITVNTQTFEDQVMRSPVPVLVDFWADWCGPCKSLAPILEKLADEYDGRLVVAKVNVDEEPEIASVFRIQSLPTMMLFVGGQPVQQIVGAQPEAAIRSTIDPHLDSMAADLAPDANAADPDPLAGLSAEQLISVLTKQLQHDPEQPGLVLQLAKAHTVLGNIDEAESLLGRVDRDASEKDEYDSLLAAIEFSKNTVGLMPVADATTRLQSDDGDLDARYAIAMHAAAASQTDVAGEHFLEIMRRDRSYAEDAGRRSLLNLFRLLKNEGELVGDLRRRMSSLLH